MILGASSVRTKFPDATQKENNLEVAKLVFLYCLWFSFKENTLKYR